jgi:hypothetical protein
MSRKPEGERALTKAERDARYRQRQAAYLARLEDAIRRILEEARTLREAREIAASVKEGERK